MASPTPPPLPPYPPPLPPPMQARNGMAVAGLVLGLCAFVVGWVIPLLLSVLAIVFSAIGLGRAARAGRRGMAIAGLVLGILSLAIPILAAVAIPAFTSYMKKSKTTEAGLVLNKISRSAKRLYGETSRLPEGTSAQLPANPDANGAGASCCGGKGGGPNVNNKCAPNPAAFDADPIWSALEFRVDEPSQYQLQYAATPTGATVTAIGDLDCDGVSATWTLTITKTPSGSLETNLTPPPSGVY